MQSRLRTTALEEERNGGREGGIVGGRVRPKLGPLSL